MDRIRSSGDSVTSDTISENQTFRMTAPPDITGPAKPSSPKNLAGDVFDPDMKTYMEFIPQVAGDGSKYISVQGDNHEDPSTGSHTIYYPSRGN